MLTVDEQLPTLRGRRLLSKCIQSKAGKYGIKFWVICDSQISYTLKLDIHKNNELSEQRASNLGTTAALNYLTLSKTPVTTIALYNN